jgi:Na+-driven multidrug efflux pump
LGQGKQQEIFPLIRKIVYLAFIWVIIIAPVIILRPEWALIIITNDPLIIQASLKPLYVISVALLIFVPGVIFIQALSGTGDTRTAFLIELVAISAYLFYTWLMTIVLKMNLEYVWMAEIVYWTIVLIFSYYRLRSGKWKGIKV